MIAILLMEKILSMFLLLVIAFIMVRIGAVKASDSMILSRFLVLLVMPAACLAMFQIECTVQTVSGLALAFGAALLLTLFGILLLTALKKPLGLNDIEICSILFTNCSNLLFPIVISVLGQEWLIYASGFTVVQTFAVWSYAYVKLSGQNGIQLKKIFCTPTMICTLLGAFFFACNIRFPALLADSLSMVTDLLAPLSMIVSGMLLGGMDFSACKGMMHRSFWITILFRLLVYPLCAALLFRFCLGGLIPNGRDVLLVTLLAAAAPTATALTQMLQTYGGNSRYCNLLNVVSTVGCVLTMPFIVLIYGML